MPTTQGCSKRGRVHGSRGLFPNTVHLGHAVLPCPALFTAQDRARLHPKRISALLARLVRAAALPSIPLHGLRHTYASLALAKGVNAAIVSKRLGHATVAFTLDIYSHVLPQLDAEAAEFIATFPNAAKPVHRLERDWMPIP